MRLLENEKEKIRFHLGYVEGGPSSSRAVLEYRMNNVRSHLHHQLIRTDINRCDYALERLGLDDQNTAVTSSTVTLGDLDRNTTVYAAEPMRRRQKAYHDQRNHNQAFNLLNSKVQRHHCCCFPRCIN